MEGGTPSAYVYPPDPVNNYDLDGKNTAEEVFDIMGQNANDPDTGHKITGLLAIGAAVCLTGVGTAVCVGVAATSVLVAGASAYNNTSRNVSDAAWAMATAGAFEVVSGVLGSFVSVKSIPYIAPKIAEKMSDFSQHAINVRVVATKQRLSAATGYVASLVTNNLVPNQSQPLNVSNAYLNSVNKLVASLIGSPFVGH